MLTSEIIIKPGLSSRYVRFILACNIMATVLILHAKPSLAIQWVLLVFLWVFYFLNFKRSPCPEIQALRLSAKSCQLILNNNTSFQYEKLSIPIRTPLFILVQLTAPNTRQKVFALFNDQLSLLDLRLMHVKAEMC